MTSIINIVFYLQMEERNVSGLLDTTTLSSRIDEASTTPDEASYIAQHLGAQHLPLTTIIPITVVYSIIFIVGVLGNVSTICVILKNKYMHTPTNVYLANLALSDLLTHVVGESIIQCEMTNYRFFRPGHFSRHQDSSALTGIDLL